MNNPIGVVSCHLRFASIPEAFALAQRYALDEIEWFESDGTAFANAATAAEIRCLAARCGVRSVLHAPWQGRWDLGLLSARQARRELAGLLDRAADLEADRMTLHLGHHPPHSDRNAALEGVIAAIAGAAARAERLAVRIAVENFTGCFGAGALGDRVADFDRLFAAVPSTVGLTLDAGHAHITGTLAGLLRGHGGRLLAAHLHDNDGTTDAHLPPGEGTVDWPALLGALAKCGYDGALTFEFPEASGKYPQFIRQIRDFPPGP